MQEHVVGSLHTSRLVGRIKSDKSNEVSQTFSAVLVFGFYSWQLWDSILPGLTVLTSDFRAHDKGCSV